MGDGDAQSGICVANAWDPKLATFASCFMPFIALFPSIVSACILLGQALRFLIPQRAQWMRPFVEEHVEPVVEIDLVSFRKWTRYTKTLLAFSTGGLAIQAAGSILDSTDITAYLPILPWIVVLLQLVVFRPRTTPYAVLWILILQFVALVVLSANAFWHGRVAHVLSAISAATCALKITVLLFMPLRDPLLSSKDIGPPGAEPTSALRSPEDNLTLFQFLTVSWMFPLLSLAKKRQLEATDVWTLPYERQHTQLHENFRELQGSIIARLLTANMPDLITIIFLGLLELILTYAAPVLLQRILSSMEDPTVPTQVAVVYSALVLVTRLANAQIGVFTLWFGRRCYERARGEMMTTLHEKTLARKIAFAPPQDEQPKSSTADDVDTATSSNMNGHGSADDHVKHKPSLWQRFRQLFARKRTPLPVAEPASMGKILNLMRHDVYEVAQRFIEFDSLVKVPLSVIFSMTLVVNYLGWSSMLAVAVVVAAQLISAGLARIMVYIEKKRRVATDEKLKIIGHFIEALRHLRWYGWQGSWLAKVLEAREKELSWRVTSSAVSILIAFVNTLSLDLTPALAFYAYTVLAHRRLTVDIAFPAVQLFGMMTFALNELPALITTLINAWVALTRIEEFMAEPDREEKATEALIGDTLSLQAAAFAWPSHAEPVLRNVDLSFPPGLTVIAGEVASGKTALLQGLLGELDLLSGQLLRPPLPIGYCSQTPWLQSMSIRENILFSEHYDEARYQQVLRACALLPDLAEFPGADHALIGENGVGLSGGQRARVALARAVYSNTKILLLDDPLSALDQQTAEAIVDNCLLGPLMQGRTVLLVTHRTELVVGAAQQLITLQDGTAQVTERDSAARLQSAPSLAEKVANQSPATENGKASATPAKFLDDEKREQGEVKLSVYWAYIKAGTLTFWGLLILNVLVFRGFILGEQWFLKEWGEAYNTQSATAFPIAWAAGHMGTHQTPMFTASNFTTQSWISDRLPPPEDNPGPWLTIFFLLGLGNSIAFVISQLMVIVIVYTAGKNMFRDIMQRVSYATFRFYDVTPVGRLMNRMTSDLGVIDGGISQQFSQISWLLIGWLSGVVVIAAATPVFLAFAVVLLFLFVRVFNQFIGASQNLRRLEMVNLTPLMSNYGALLNGLDTVRAFRAQPRFQARVIGVIDTFQKMDHLYWGAQSWLMYRFDVLSALSTFVLFMLALAINLSPGLTAFVLLSAQRFVNYTHNLCKQYGRIQMEFVSVERVVELLDLEQEAPGSVVPAAWWPSFAGDVVFEDVTIRYAAHLDPALSNLSFTIPGGSKTAILGRTGSGKSTLALALIATLLPTTGRITIDGLDLAAVDKQTLRSRVTFLAQDPVLFPGSMRENLDPTREHADAACATVLARCCARQGWSLHTKVEAGGKNLSQGQRQLVGLARAVLRRSAIIILDEATASIDRETAMQIQQVMQEEMKESTVITIAHRLEAVRNADYCIVLGKGRILEQGPAKEMLRAHREEGAASVADEEDS